MTTPVIKAVFALLAMVIVAAALIWKFLFWSGPFPPDRGWSERQLRRMKQGRSPWWF